MEKYSLYTAIIDQVKTGSITLRDNINNYDDIMIIYGLPHNQTNNRKFNSVTISRDFFVNNYPYVANPTYNTPHLQLTFADGATALRLLYSANRELYAYDSYGSVFIKEIIGYKYDESEAE